MTQTTLTNGQLQARLATKGEYALMMWNHRSRRMASGTFAFAPTREAAEKMAREYVAYLPENQVQVSKTGCYPIEVVLRLWNHDGQVKEI
jgi:hypothetical protein